MFYSKSEYKFIKFIKSPIRFKKYRAVLQNKKTKQLKNIDFGDNRYEHYHDSTGLNIWSHKNHNDINRRRNYFSRHSGIPFRGKSIEYEKQKNNGYYNPKILSHMYLW